MQQSAAGRLLQTATASLVNFGVAQAASLPDEALPHTKRPEVVPYRKNPKRTLAVTSAVGIIERTSAVGIIERTSAVGIIARTSAVGTIERQVDQPGIIRPNGRPANRWTWKCGTSCPECSPILASNR
jgi:hypothetical protein